MPACERFEVAVVPASSVDVAVVKRRPALSLRTAASARANGHGLFAVITTAKRRAWPGDVPLTGWREAGLTAPSVLRWKVFTLPEGQVLGRLGRLATEDESAAARGLAPLLGPDPGGAASGGTRS